ncbi:hypothetical protein C9J27_02775 [Photobacterium kishitanii]|uniref:Uncharacterized protein n=1 Tax=Photobacterium kishitanii TaxID=318456 RepID=A0A2T3KME1_9GAMM|nr:hypothetical protein C9J27_02775 [Photobacterium kishitanii]
MINKITSTSTVQPYFNFGLYAGVVVLLALTILMFVYSYRGFVKKDKSIMSRVIHGVWGGMLTLVLLASTVSSYITTSKHISSNQDKLSHTLVKEGEVENIKTNQK